MWLLRATASALLVVSSPALAANVYVATTGTDSGDCPPGSPCATIQYALDTPGFGNGASDTCFVADGTYYPTAPIIFGLFDDNCALVAPGCAAVIDGTAAKFTDDKQALVQMSRDGLTLSGFQITNSPKRGVNVTSADNCVIRYCHVHDNPFEMGIVPWESDNGVISDCEIYNNGTNSSDGTSHGIYIQWHCNGWLVENNYVHHNGEAGLHINGNDDICRDHVVRDNLFERNGSGGDFFNARDCVLFNNVFVDDCWSLLSNPDVCADTSCSGGQIPLNARSIVIANNTFVNKHETYAIRLFDSNMGCCSGFCCADSNFVFNNIAISEGPTAIQVGAGTVGNQLSNNYEASYASVNLDSMFMNPAGNDYRLRPGTTYFALLHDAGIAQLDTAKAPSEDKDGVLRPQGTANDIGAFEAGATVQANISTFMRDAGGTLHSLPGEFALGCPQGDLQEVVIFVDMQQEGITAPIPAEAVTLDPLYGTGNEIYSCVFADSPAVFYDGYYRTTLTIESFGGCGEDSARVYLHGFPLGYAHFNFRSPDVAVGGASYGSVELVDLAVFASHYPPGPYGECADFAPPAGEIDLIDLVSFAPHYGHKTALASASFPAPRVAIDAEGTLELALQDVYAIDGSRKLRGSLTLHDTERFQVVFIAIRNDNPNLRFSGWHCDAEYPRNVLGVEVNRDNHREIGILAIGDTSLDTSVIRLGEFDLDVLGDEPFELSEEDFAFPVADLLGLDGSVRKFPVERRELTRIQLENSLAQNYPNPFNPVTTIAFSIAKATHVDLRIYDAQGRLVRSLVNDVREGTNYRVTWDGKNGSGQPVASGVYFYRLVAGEFTSTKKMVLLR